MRSSSHAQCFLCMHGAVLDRVSVPDTDPNRRPSSEGRVACGTCPSPEGLIQAPSFAYGTHGTFEGWR